MVMNGEEGLECEAHVDRVHLKHVSKFKYWGYVMEQEQVGQNVLGRWQVGRGWQVPLGP